jgi:hypothetical protein
MKKLIFLIIINFMMNFSANAQNETARFPRFLNDIKIETDIVQILGPDCFIIQVRVIYLAGKDGYDFTYVFGNVQVGQCSRPKLLNQNPNCADIELKGEYIFNSSYQSEKCLSEVLQDEIIYQKYANARDTLLSSIKK